MKIKFNTYKRREGVVMLYANNDRKVSVGIAENGVPSPYGKNTTAGQRNIIENLSAALNSIESRGGAQEVGEIDINSHTEQHYRLGSFGHLFITDIATVAGVKTGSDGAFLYKNGKLYDLSIAAEV